MYLYDFVVFGELGLFVGYGEGLRRQYWNLLDVGLFGIWYED